MKGWRARIKEVGNPHLLTPELYGDFDEEYAIKFWGLNQPDVEWYKLEAIEEA